jgi:hypothetical protein
LNLLFAALLLPTLFWDQPPNTADLLRNANIRSIAVPPSNEIAWKQVSGFTVETVDPSQTAKLPKPGVRFRVHEASATSAPWVDSDAWRILRQPSASFFYEAPGESAAIAAAEAFTYGAKAVIHTDQAGLKPLGAMLAFLASVDGPKLPPLANFDFVDDGTPESGEFMNLLIRRNLLFRVVKNPDPTSAVTVKLGSPRYPRSEAANPSLLAEKVRAEITDQKRLIRIYGSEIVVARLEGDKNSARVYLINYAGHQLVVDGIRVRVLGKYTHFKVSVAGVPDQSVSDPLSTADATEFTLKHLKTLAVIDLTR